MLDKSGFGAQRTAAGQGRHPWRLRRACDSLATTQPNVEEPKEQSRTGAPSPAEPEAEATAEAAAAETGQKGAATLRRRAAEAVAVVTAFK